MAFVEADSFCTEAGVVSRVQRGDYNATTIPTEDQVLDFMGLRAAQIQSALWNAGYLVTVPSGGNAIDNSDDSGKTVERLTRAANEMLAGGDAIFAADSRHDQKAPDAAVGLWREGASLIKQQLIPFVKKFVTQSDRSATATGGITKSDFGETGYEEERKVSEVFNLEDLW